MTATDKQVIGRVVKLSIANAGIFNLPAKIDTGAYSSAIWATKIKEEDGQLSFVLLGPKSPKYTGEVITTKQYTVVTISNSFGKKQDRYRINLKAEIDGRKINAKFTLANRALKSYPALIGRRILNKRFMVDVSLGGPILKSEWR
jgi:hypothetical protein